MQKMPMDIVVKVAKEGRQEEITFHTWDFGGHVQFSHYDYFDALMDSLLGADGWYMGAGVVRRPAWCEAWSARQQLGGVEGVIERYVQLRQALDRLSQRELDWAKTEVDRLIETLTEVATQLEQLRAIKLAIVDPN